ncbi:MAG: murein biosynthesis integral membrane protein MurJ [Actinomycetota bacterium]
MVEEVAQTPDDLEPDPGELPTDDPRTAFVRDTALMSVGTTLSRITGLLRVSAQTAAVGVSALGNTYATANTTPNIVYELVLGGILTSVFVPVFVEWLQKHGREEAWLVADRVLTLALVVLAAVAVLGAIFAPQIIRLFLSASDATDKEAQIALGAFFLRWFMPQIVFYGVGAVATGLLQAERRFAAPMFAPILNNLSVIATFGVYALLLGNGTASVEGITFAEKTILAAGTTFGVAAMTLALWPSLRRLGFRWHLRFDWNHPAVRRLGKLALWVVVYVAANQLAYIAVIVFTGKFPHGYQVYASAFILFQLPHAIVAVSIFTALLPPMSSRWADRDLDGLRTLFSHGTRDTLVVIVPAALGYVALAFPIVRLLLQHGRAQPVAVEDIARTLQAFAVGLPFFSAFQLLTRTFYAMQDTKTPALVNVAAAFVNVGANFLYLSLGWGLPGLALGHATSYAFATLVCLAVLRTRLGGIDGTRILATLVRVIPASLMAAGAALLASRGIQDAFGSGTGTLSRLAQVSGGVVAGLLVFAVSTLIVKIDEADEVKEAVLRRFRR